MLNRLQASLADRYRIVRELGHGGMATVYLAQDLQHDRPVALKVLRPDLAHIVGPERFLREIRLCGRLQHPHIVAIHDSGDADGQLWFTMPYIEGETLRSRLLREKQLPVEDAVRICVEVADALHYAHQRGVIHRDIKPENILLSGLPTRDGGLASGYHALVADFGIARTLPGEPDERLTESGLSVGTPHYMSPEQGMADRNIDLRTDIYSLGCVLYEMLTGEPPYTGPNPQAVLAKRLTEPVPHVRTGRDVSVTLERAVTRALARSPADRFATAADFAGALQSGQGHGSAGGKELHSRARLRRPMLAQIAIGTGLLLLVALSAFAMFRRGGPSASASLASAAVLPFVDLSAEKDQEYFSDGLTEELITALSQVSGLRVAARTSSFQFKGQNADVHEVGRKLDVGAVLEGSVRKSGNRLRVSVQLINVKDGYQLWSESYDRDLADVFAVQEDVARSIVAALRLRLAPARDSALAVRPTRDLQAYDLYLKGRFAWNLRTGQGMTQAVNYLEQAVARDSSFAQAWAALADAYILIVPFSGVGSSIEAWQKAQGAANRALALDHRSAEAYAALGYGNTIYAWDWASAEQNFLRAIAADSTYATGHQWYGDFLVGRGRLAEGLAQMHRAHQLDPLSRQIGIEWGWTSYLMRLNDSAEVHIREVLALDPNYAQAYYRLGLVQIQERHDSAAMISLRRAADLGAFRPQVMAALASAQAGSGDMAGAKAIVQELERRREEGELIPPVHIAIAYGALGDETDAIAWLNRGIDQHDIYIPENFYEPLMDPLRKDPRFKQVLARMGIAAATP
ncbi:MAG TPA: protein kinase [Gemmatimonadales bacterium]|jgi:serine/threonine-protein kinase